MVIKNRSIFSEVALFFFLCVCGGQAGTPMSDGFSILAGGSSRPLYPATRSHSAACGVTSLMVVVSLCTTTLFFFFLTKKKRKINASGGECQWCCKYSKMQATKQFSAGFTCHGNPAFSLFSSISSILCARVASYLDYIRDTHH